MPKALSNEIKTIISQIEVSQSVKIEIVDPIGEISKSKEIELKSNILKLMKDKSNLVTGTYCLGNFETFPDNVYITLSSQIDENYILMNVNSKNKRIIILGSKPTKKLYRCLINILSSINSFFAFVSGTGITGKIEHDLDLNRILRNIVFEFRNNLIKSLNKYYAFDFYVYPQKFTSSEEDDLDFDQLKLLVMNCWDYSEKDFNQIIRPHVIAVENNKVMGGARANSLTEEYAVIGGVITLKTFRKRGVGTAVSAKITDILANKLKKNVSLETDVDNFPAIKIYTKIGFNEVGKSIFMDKNIDLISQLLEDRDY